MCNSFDSVRLYAGHVTAGGSICIEALTLSGTAGSWTSQFNVESILNIVILNMLGEVAVDNSFAYT